MGWSRRTWRARLIPAPMAKTPIPVYNEVCQHHQCGDDHAGDQIIDSQHRYEQCHQNERDTEARNIYGKIPRKFFFCFWSCGFKCPYAVQGPADQIYNQQRNRHGQQIMKSSKFGQYIKRCDSDAKAKCADEYKTNQLFHWSYFHTPQLKSHFPFPELPIRLQTKCVA